MAAVIWVASSRVGASTRPVGWPGRRLASARRATNGIEKASVLPLPVLPRPSTSRPARVSGRVLTWIGNGSVIPRADRLLISRAGTPRSANELLEVIVVWCLSGIRVCRRRQTISTKWRDCRGAKSIAAKKLGIWCRSIPRRCQHLWTPTLFVSLPDEQGFPVIDDAV